MRPLLNLGSTHGSFIVITGCAHSGKSNELITQAGICQHLGHKAAVFVPAQRNSAQQELSIGLRSHDGRTFEAIAVASWADLAAQLPDDTRVVIIDDVHSLSSDLARKCAESARQGRLVIVAGRDLDAEGTPSETVSFCLALADQAMKKHAVCGCCGHDASFTCALGGGAEQPRCRVCFLLRLRSAFVSAAT